MSCFGLRAERDSFGDLQFRHTPSPRSPPRRPFGRTRTYSSRPSSKSSVDSAPLPSSAPALPVEDLSATKRRLVVIRRQPDAAALNLQVGFKSRTGWQPLSISRENQDALALVLPLAEPLQDYSLFAVFDGHGRGGHRVSAYVAESLAAAFAAALAADKTTPTELALRRACVRTSRALANNKGLDVAMTGTTAAVAVVHGRRLVCANVGDSRIIVATVRDGLLKPLVLTTDHVPSHPKEQARIEAAGGRVESWTPAGCDTGPPRVWLKERRIPGLSMSRVLGDSILDGIVTAEPELTAHVLAEEDRFIVVATDGIWGQMSNEDVVDFIAQHNSEPCQRIAEALVRHAASLWFDAGGESIDDISLILVRLNW